MVSPNLTLIVDSREQNPLEFKAGVFNSIKVRGLPVADYWAELSGKEVPICFERKALGDLYGTMTSGYSRFKKELEKAKAFQLKVVLLIEGSLRTVHGGYEYSKFGGDSMLRKLGTLYVRYDLEWHCFEDRRSMAKFIEITFDACRRNYRRKKDG